jgi:predicted alpha/beta superfamily hydrolase
MLRQIGLLLILMLIASALDAAEPSGLVGQPLTAGERLSLKSELLGEERVLSVALPEDYEKSDSRYPVLYVLDGEWHFPHAQALVWFLAHCGHVRTHPVPPMIVVGIENVDRSRDYTPTHREEQHGMLFPTSGQSDRFLGFLESELIPFIDENYRTQPYRILSGWSFGGLFCITTLFSGRDVFDGYIAISPSLWWDDGLVLEQAKDLFEQQTELESSLIITLGDETRLVRPAVLDFVTILKAKAPQTLDWDIDLSYGEEHNLVPPMALYKGLRMLYYDWNMPDNMLSEGLGAVDEYYSALSLKYGYAITPPEDLLTRLARSYWYSDEFETALEVCLYRRDIYPGRPSSYFFLGAAYENLGDKGLAAANYKQAYDLEAASPLPGEASLNMYQGALERVIED